MTYRMPAAWLAPSIRALIDNAANFAGRPHPFDDASLKRHGSGVFN